jgi:signal transduction histidine kinase
MRTLKRELILVNIAATGAALLVAIALLFSSELRTWKEALVRDISIKADIIGSQCTAALTFNAPKDAEEILRALQADAQIEHAVVYTANGTVFAAYRGRSGQGQVLKSPPAEGNHFTTDHLDLTRSIVLHEETIGSITIRANLDQLRTLLIQYGFGSTLVLLLALTASSGMLSRLQRTVTEPVTDLVLLMETVSRDKDYAQRACGSGPKEFVSLAGSFNEMLTAIQSRDRELERSLVELKKAYGKLEDLDRLKSYFISTVSHELRTPITSIKAFVELLLIKPDMMEDRKARLLETINSEADRLSRLIGDLLDLSRIESGVMKWRDQDVVLAEIVRSAVNGILPLAKGRGIQIEETVEDGLPTLHADRDRIMQVVMNLLSNAVKFTQQGGRITISTSHTASPSEIAVSVSDTGPGIPHDDLRQIFERFHRSGDVLTNTIEGTGLGLSISREIVEHYGGRIWAASEVGRGSVFTFSIPLERMSGGQNGSGQ